VAACGGCDNGHTALCPFSVAGVCRSVGCEESSGVALRCVLWSMAQRGVGDMVSSAVRSDISSTLLDGSVLADSEQLLLLMCT
jgi:hypothetical protein